MITVVHSQPELDEEEEEEEEGAGGGGGVWNEGDVEL